ncbi:prefoldin-like protein [Aspergillus saccharolyticus JOP 1030-1]|uniref:DUF3835 domain-containing protein n=1 Tax=Aspergillus saccharolyticus JOP 1030-1 TaxID=1450539 RepID=A0A318ZKB8_9EURO|nr:hypothetical protein BP01DRAFT_314259 [Aspergillus saccharolyticus JOP 1030-1]PYH47297.1 hypothetical protein BP01DRAFT_314259 [Aspergillus saccharolyticus JOP 1030-1]
MIMGVPDRQLHELERQRLELEGNISKLQESLYHWRTWEAEYEGLKEGINDLPDDATSSDFLRVGHNLAGSLVTEDEVKLMLGDKEGVTRTKGQVINLIARRIDYVKQNVTAMEKRLRAAESGLYALDSQEQPPSETTAEFPMTEIFEELDENGDIISSKTTTPGSQAPELLNALQKAGVKDIPDLADVIPAQNDSLQHAARPTEGSQATGENPTTLEVEEVNPPDAREEQAREATTPEHNHKPPAMDAAGLLEYQRLAACIEESPEDAQLRREMLQYSLNEVGAVVAELELDEDASDVSVDEDYEDYDDDEDEEEDEYGRTTGRILDEDYHREMRELEAKLNARGLWNIGKNTDFLPTDVKAELEQPSIDRVETIPETGSEPVPEKKPKKRVAFADDLDIAPAPKPPVQDKKVVPVRESSVPVLADSVVERTQPVAKEPSTKGAPKKVSRFKSARKTDDGTAEPTTASETSTPGPSRPVELRSSLRKTSTPSPAPSSLPLFPARPAEPKPFSQPISDIAEKDPAPRGPEGKILADTLVERDVSASSAMAPEPDELDEQLHRKEIATEFYQIRNRMIKEKGGFVDEEPEIVPLETEEAPRRVSKFKATRMR